MAEDWAAAAGQWGCLGWSPIAEHPAAAGPETEGVCLRGRASVWIVTANGLIR